MFVGSVFVSVFIRLSLNALTETSGTKHGLMDVTTAGGYSPEYVAEQTYNGYMSGKEEIVIAQTKARLGILLKSYFPSIFHSIMKQRTKNSE